METTIQVWLKRQRGSEAMAYFGCSLAALLSGVFVLFLTFWLAYAVIFMGWLALEAGSQLIFSRPFPFHLIHRHRIIGSAFFLGLLFIGNFRTSREYLSDYPVKKYLSAPALQASAAGALVTLLAYPGASSKMITDLLFTGPRLVMGGFGLFKQAINLIKIKVDQAARLLAILLGQTAAISPEKLAELLGLPNLDELLPSVKTIPGVVFLESGLTLTDDLRAELQRLKNTV